MPPIQTDFTVGKQLTLVLIINGAVVGTANLTDFESKQEKIKLKSRPINGKPINKWLPDGWTGTMTFDRVDATMDDYFSNEEEAYWAGGAVPTIYIQEIVAENDGSVSQYRYSGVQLEFDGGSWAADKTVVQKANFVATDRPKVQ